MGKTLSTAEGLITRLNRQVERQEAATFSCVGSTPAWASMDKDTKATILSITLIVLVIGFLLLWGWSLEARGYTEAVFSFGSPEGRDCIWIKTTMYICKP
jgi:hypothetical protein